MSLNYKTYNKYNYKFKQSNHILRKGNFGIKSNSFGRLTETQLNFLYKIIFQNLKKSSIFKKSIKIWGVAFLNLNLTKLSLESRMGKGKGSIYTKACFFKPGDIVFEFESYSNMQALILLFKLQKNCSLNLVLIKKN
nr:ribosomal protein L16 [Calliblepharis sp.]